LEAALLLGLMITAPRRHPDEAIAVRASTFLLLGIVTAANIVALVLLIQRLLAGGITEGSVLVFAAIQIWVTNVLVFGLWFWEIDRGGPGVRTLHTLDPDFLFPQMATTNVAPAGW